MDNTVNKLVFKLTKSEKNYFVKFIKNKEISEPFYFQLYNDILKKGVISADDLSNDIKPKINLKKFSAVKEQLLEKILISLTNNRFENSHRWKIHKDIHFIQILIEKELYTKAQKYLINTKKIAYHYEEFELLLQLINIEISLCFKNCFIVNYSKLKELYKEQKKVLKIIKNINKLLIIKAELQQYQLNEDFYGFDLNHFIQLYGHSPFIPKKKILSIKAKSIWFYIQSLCCYIKFDYQQDYDYNTKQYNLLKNFSYLFNRNEYLQLMNNYLFCCCLLKKEDDFNSLVNELINLKNQTFEETQYITKVILIRKLELYHQIKYFEEAYHLGLEAEKNFILNKPISNHYEIKYLQLLIIRAYIEICNYNAAISLSNKSFKIEGPTIESALFKIFEFIAHYKLGNFENLLYSVNSWAKTIRSKRKQLPIEKILIKFFRTVCNIKNQNEKLKLISNVIIQLKELEQNNLKTIINQDFDFIVWFERELEEMNTN